MKKPKLLHLIVALTCLTLSIFPEAPAAQEDSSKTRNVYSANEIGWTIEIPVDWERRTEEEISAGRARGTAFIEQQKNIKLPAVKTGLLYLKHKHGRAGRFTSDLSPYDLNGYKDYRELQAERFSVATNILTSQGANFSAKQGQATIDGIQFQTLELKVMSPKDGGLVMLMKIYDGVVGNKSLIISYVASPPSISSSIESAISTSKFGRPSK
jgi:hypothetical protein